MTNITNYTALSGTGIPEGARIVFATIAVLLLVCGSLGNGMLLVVLCVNRSTWKENNVFVGHLAFCSLPVLFSSLPFVIIDLIADRSPEDSSSHCQPIVSLFNVGYMTWVYTLTAIAFSRYITVCHNHIFHAYFSFKTLFSGCAALWLLALVISVPTYSCRSDSVHSSSDHHCGVRTMSNVLPYSIAIFCVNLIASTFIIASFYAAIFYRMQKSCKRCMSYKRVRSHSVYTHYPLQGSVCNFPSTCEQVHCTETSVTRAVDQSSSPTKYSRGSRGSVSDTVCNLSIQRQTALEGHALRRLSSSLPELVSISPTTKVVSSFTRVLQELVWTSREKTFMRKLLIVSVTNFVVFMPYVFAVAIDFFTPLVCEILVSAHMLLLVNPSLSWLIYGIMSSNIYNAYKELFRKLFFRGKRIC